MRFQPVCLLRLACWRRRQEGEGNCSKRESRVEEEEGSECVREWVDGWIVSSPFAL